MFAARRSKAGRAAAETGAAVPLAATMLVGSWYCPLTRNSKCRCGPVAQPVAPTAPSVWPCSIDWAGRTSLRLRRAETAARRLGWVGGKVWGEGGAPSLQDRMQGHREAAGHARELHRGAQVGAAHALAVWRVVGALGRPWLLEPDRLVGLAVVDELGAEHPAGAQRLAIGLQRFVDHREAVALAQRAPKVDVARE